MAARSSGLASAAEEEPPERCASMAFRKRPARTVTFVRRLRKARKKRRERRRARGMPTRASGRVRRTHRFKLYCNLFGTLDVHAQVNVTKGTRAKLLGQLELFIAAHLPNNPLLPARAGQNQYNREKKCSAHCAPLPRTQVKAATKRTHTDCDELEEPREGLAAMSAADPRPTGRRLQTKCCR